MFSEIEIDLIENECWWGGAVTDGHIMPFDSNTLFQHNLDPNDTPNQAVSILLSSKGRIIWCDRGFEFAFDKGVLHVNSNKSKILLYDGYENLKGAYNAASKMFFPGNGNSPAELFFTKPIYNTWIELMYNQNENQIIEYAKNLIESGMPPGVLMIDCGWQEYYGKWDFHPRKFNDPAGMVKKLHSMGFKIMLWICPFVSADSIEYRFLRDRNLLVKDTENNPSIKKWWDGYSAVLDFTNPDTVNWFEQQNQNLIEKYNIDGFKFDAGDAYFYSDNDVCYEKIDANTQTELWARFGLRYKYNEYRACFKCGGLPLVQRLCDKHAEWGFKGLGSIIPGELSLGIIGHPYSCPDMIGGGDYLNFLETCSEIDQELFVRYAQCASLMPMMQFSAAPWRVLDNYHFNLCKEAVEIRFRYMEKILRLVNNARSNLEPMVRYMEYVFPNEGFEKINDQFMLGNEILVAPVLQKGQNSRTVKLPSGTWKYIDGKTYDGNKIIEIATPLEILPVFERIIQVE